MKRFYKFFALGGIFMLFSTTPLLADDYDSKPHAKETIRPGAEKAFMQDLFIIAPADIDTGVEWEECSILIPHDELGTPTIPENCNGCTVTQDRKDNHFEYYNIYYPGTTIVTWTVTDALGNKATDTQLVTVRDNQPPIFPYFQPDTYLESAEQDACGAHVNFAPPSAGDNCSQTTITQVSGNYKSGDFFEIGTTSLTYEAVDESGNSDHFTIYITVLDTQYPFFTGDPEPVTRSADAGTSGATFELPVPEALDNCGTPVVSSDAPATFPIGTTTVTWTAIDAYGNIATATQLVTITSDNVCPELGLSAIQAPAAAQAVNRAVAVSAAVTGSDLSRAIWYWGDGSQSAATQSGSTLGGSHRYSSAGIYMISLTIENACGETASATHELVVYDPAAGFVTGGGWFNSPAGAWRSKPNVAGKAHISLNSKYHKGDLTPKGNFVFKIQSGGLNFKGTTQQWLMVDDHQAIYKGMGMLNGMSGYSYMVSVVDGDMLGKKVSDKLRIVLWNPAGEVVYDNQPGAALGAEAAQALDAGSIVIHGTKKDKKNAKTAVVASADEATVAPGVMAAYPNPLVSEGLWLAFPALGRSQDVKVVVYDLSGRVMAEKIFTVSIEAGHYHWAIDHSSWSQGVYILVIRADQFSQQLKIIK